MSLRRYVILCLLAPPGGNVAAMAGETPTAAPVVRASSVHDGGYDAKFAIDGDLRTRWASRSFSGRPEWLMVDFGRAVAPGSLVIHWEAAYAAEYEIQISDDGRAWRTVHRQSAGKGGRETIAGLDAAGRYLRVLCLKPDHHKLFSIWELSFPAGPAAEVLAAMRRLEAESRKRAEAALRERLAPELRSAGAREIVFAARHPGGDGHWYANFGYYARDTNRKVYGRPGGRLYRLDIATGRVTVLLDDPEGSVRDPCVHYDGKRIVFSYRQGRSQHFNLFEINADGTGLRRVTDGPWDDIEPAYLPDGGIVFCSSRCKRWVNCWLTEVAVLYRCDGDGRNMRPLSSNNEHDNTPWVLPDGRILYQRWEYVDRSQVDFHHLWTMNPDGTGQTVYFGNMHPGTVMIDAKPIPGGNRVLAVFSPGHGQREHEGPFYVVDPNYGPDEPKAARRVPGLSGRDPFPVGDRWILYAAGRAIRVADYEGTGFDLYADPVFELHEPRPLGPRPRETVIPPRTRESEASGRLLLADVHLGRNMAGVRRGEIRRLLVLETLPKPINFTGGMDPLTWGGSFTLQRLVGTVPVEEDGSAYFELPALRSFFFVALDEHNMSVKRMQSFLTVQPGEVTGCVGCHEQRTQTVSPRRDLLALRRPPSAVQPLAGMPDVLDYPRDVQPILDRHCLSCHDYDRPPGAAHGPRAGDVILSGDRGPMFSHSYAVMTLRRLFSDGRNEPRGNRPPRSIGTSASPVMKMLDGGHYGAKPSAAEVDVLRWWIESGAAYPGTYAALGTGMIGGYDANNLVENDAAWKESREAAAAIRSRCGQCHQGQLSLPTHLADENGLSFWRPDWNDPRLKRSRHIVFNLSRPDRSLILLAPLARSAGGYGICAEKSGRGDVFADTADADYRRILAMCAAGRTRLEQITRFDMAGFRPDPAYIREMKRYGILPAASGAAQEPVNVYDLDQAYWRSLWWQPAAR